MISKKGNVEAREACETRTQLVRKAYSGVTVISGKGNVEACEVREARTHHL
jgi:hypothetical protein